MNQSEVRNWLAEGLNGVAAIRLQAGDVGCALFPKSGTAPSEALLATVRLMLYKLVADIESRLTGEKAIENQTASWMPLCTSGLLRDQGLIDFCLARYAEQQIRLRLEQTAFSPEQQLAASLLHNPDPMIAEAAAHVLRGENLAMSDAPDALTSQLPIDLFHTLAWKIVAGLQFSEKRLAGTPTELAASCQSLLARHDEGRSLQHAAAKLVYFLPEDCGGARCDPRRFGLSLFVAWLSRSTAVPQDRVYRLLDHDHPAAALFVLRASAMTPADAISALTALRYGRTENDQLISELELMAAISMHDAAAMLAENQLVSAFDGSRG